MRVLVRVSESGDRVGEDHPKASLTDHEIELMRAMHEEGSTYPELAKIFEKSVHTVGRICRYERRNTATARVKAVFVFEESVVLR